MKILIPLAGFVAVAAMMWFVAAAAGVTWGTENAGAFALCGCVLSTLAFITLAVLVWD